MPRGCCPPAAPDLGALRDLGFTGSDERVLARAAGEAPQILRAVCSASSMWTANAATVTPSLDAPDGRVHFTPANLQSSFHRFLEPATTGRVLAAIFRDAGHFTHHPVLPATPAFSDEGAANHTRLAGDHGEPGVHLYVYGRTAFGWGTEESPAPRRFPARQTLEASQAVARQHGLAESQVVFAQQHPDAIDAGVFHNDVIAVGNGPVLLYHEMAFLDEAGTLEALRERINAPLIPLRIPGEAVSLADAVSSYLFNSQLLSNPDGSMTLVVPGECQENEAVWRTSAGPSAGRGQSHRRGGGQGRQAEHAQRRRPRLPAPARWCSPPRSAPRSPVGCCSMRFSTPSWSPGWSATTAIASPPRISPTRSWPGSR